MGFEDWQLHLRAMKKEEQRQKAETAEMLREYRGGIKEEDLKLSAIKNEEKKKKQDAERLRRSYKCTQVDLIQTKDRPVRQEHYPHPPVSPRRADHDMRDVIADGYVSERKIHFDSPQRASLGPFQFQGSSSPRQGNGLYQQSESQDALAVQSSSSMPTSLPLEESVEMKYRERGNREEEKKDVESPHVPDLMRNYQGLHDYNDHPIGSTQPALPKDFEAYSPAENQPSLSSGRVALPNLDHYPQIHVVCKEDETETELVDTDQTSSLQRAPTSNAFDAASRQNQAEPDRIDAPLDECIGDMQQIPQLIYREDHKDVPDDKQRQETTAQPQQDQLRRIKVLSEENKTELVRSDTMLSTTQPQLVESSSALAKEGTAGSTPFDIYSSDEEIANPFEVYADHLQEYYFEGTMPEQGAQTTNALDLLKDYTTSVGIDQPESSAKADTSEFAVVNPAQDFEHIVETLSPSEHAPEATTNGLPSTVHIQPEISGNRIDINESFESREVKTFSVQSSVIRLDVNFSFGLITATTTPCLDGYMAAVEQVIQSYAETDAGLENNVTYNASYGPSVVEIDWDGTFCCVSYERQLSTDRSSLSSFRFSICRFLHRSISSPWCAAGTHFRVGSCVFDRRLHPRRQRRDHCRSSK